VLNYIHNEGCMRETELRGLIVRDEARFNVGIMHKRSLMGILEGLKGLGILNEEEGCYYPGWVGEEQWVRRKEEPGRRMREEEAEGVEGAEQPRKRLHVDAGERVGRGERMTLNVVKKEGKYQSTKISQKRYKF
jgi:hypothetical protein